MMRALTVEPGNAGSVALEDRPDPGRDSNSLLVQMLEIGICGTDREIVAGAYGVTPPGHGRLVLGHESLGRVIEAPPGAEFRPGDLVVGIVRRPDPVPCASCAAGEWDMCRNGLYTERGIKGRDGYGAERVRIQPEYAVPAPSRLRAVAVLVEPASIVAKAFEQIERIGARFAHWQPRRALVTGAGPIGLLAALMARQRGLEVHVFDRTIDGPKPAIVRDLGATYHAPDVGSLGDLEPDIVVECTGASAVILAVASRTAACGITCLAGVSSGSRSIHVDIDAVNRTLVLENDLVFGTVNANRRHYDAAVRSLAAADAAWLRRIITRRVPLERWRDAFERRRGDIKVTLEFAA